MYQFVPTTNTVIIGKNASWIKKEMMGMKGVKKYGKPVLNQKVDGTSNENFILQVIILKEEI